MSIEANKALALRSFAAFNQRDLAAADEIYAPTYVLHNSIALPNLPAGPAGVKQQHAQYLTAFPDAQITVEDVVAEGDLVAVRMTVHGTHRGAFMGIPASGQLLSVSAMTFYRIAAGIIMEDWTIADISGMLEQIGASAPVEQTYRRSEIDSDEQRRSAWT